MTKYRTIVVCGEVVVITEDGGVACIRVNIGDDYITTIDYYQNRINEDTKPYTIWDELGEGKMYCDDFTTPYTDPKHVQTALEWLVVGEVDFVYDETIWKGF